MRLLREGANDVLPHMLSELDLSRCIAHASNASVLEPDPTERETRTIVFLHAAGGAGATTLAVNSAIELKKRVGETGEVCILDLDFQFGDTDLHLDLPARSSLTDLVNSPERLDQRMLEDLMVQGPLGIRTLTAPDMPVPLEILSADTIDRVMSVARRHLSLCRRRHADGADRVDRRRAAQGGSYLPRNADECHGAARRAPPA